MEITVRLFGVFRGISGKSKLTVKFENVAVSLKDAIEKIVKETPRLKRVLIDPELEDPRPNTLILVNGKEIGILNGLETILKDEDAVVFISILHAG